MENKKRSVSILACFFVLSIIASVVLFTLSHTSIGALCILIAIAFGLAFLLTRTSDGTSEHIVQPVAIENEEDNTVIGKYYDPSTDYDSLIQQWQDNKKLNELEHRWVEAMDSLQEEIELNEHQVTTATEDEQLFIKASLQPKYERFNVAKSFSERFNSVNNMPLLNELFNGGYFVSLEEAEKIRAKYDTILFSQTTDYSKLKTKSIVTTILLDLAFIPVFMFILGLIGESFSGHGFYTYTEAFGIGFYMFWFGAVITLPITGFVDCFVIPHFVNRAYFGDNMSETDKKNEERNAVLGITASAIAGGIIHHHIKKNKKEYK